MENWRLEIKSKKIRQIRNALLLAAGLSALASVTFFFKSRLFSRLIEQNTSDEVLFHAHTREKVIALTIDDGPHAELTPQILDVLAEYGVLATFFIIGSHVPGNEEILERIVEEGHELGNHLMSDQRSITLSADEFEHQLAAAHALIAPFGPVRWFRPGSGWYNTRMLEQIRPYNYHCVVGSIYPYDAQFQQVEFAASYILGNVQAGAIIVLHDGGSDRQGTVTVLRRILPALQKRGYHFATLSDLTKDKNESNQLPTQRFVGLSQEELIDFLELKLATLANEWRGEQSQSKYQQADAVVKSYHETMDELWALGWNGEGLLPDSELPRRLMPDYFVERWPNG